MACWEKKVFCVSQQTDSKIYVERQKTQNSQHNLEEEKRTDQRTDTSSLKDLQTSHSNEISVILEKYQI